MIDAMAKLLNEDPTGARAFVADPFPPPSGQAPYSSPYSSTRGTAETLEYSQPVPSVRAEETASGLEEDARTEWCVDFGSVLATMDTFELWAAIDRGDVAPAIRVWREGMECWTPIESLPELAIALTTASSRTPDPITLHMAPKPEAAAAPLPALEPGPVSAPVLEEVRPPQSTLISGPQTSSWTRISHRLLPPPTRRLAGAQFWAALGSAVAATAITVAVVGVMPSRAAVVPDARAVGAAVAVVPARAVPEVAVTAAAAASAVPVDVAVPATVDDEPAVDEEGPRGGEVRPRHDDRGQHRLRKSGRVSSGR